MIDCVFRKTFSENDVGQTFIKGIKTIRLFYHYFRYDPYAIKKTIYKILDTFSPRSYNKKVPLSFYVNLSTMTDYLNLDNKSWNNPTDRNELYHYSFYDLYNIAVYKAVSIIKEVNQVLYQNKNPTILNNIFLNSSYLHGKDCDLSLKMKYFEK